MKFATGRNVRVIEPPAVAGGFLFEFLNGTDSSFKPGTANNSACLFPPFLQFLIHESAQCLGEMAPFLTNNRIVSHLPTSLWNHAFMRGVRLHGAGFCSPMPFCAGANGLALGTFLALADVSPVNHDVVVASDAIDLDGTEGQVVKAHKYIPPFTRSFSTR